MRSGISIYIYSANANMGDSAMYNSDGDFLIVPQQGSLSIQTELGRLFVESTEILVIPVEFTFWKTSREGYMDVYLLLNLFEWFLNLM